MCPIHTEAPATRSRETLLLPTAEPPIVPSEVAHAAVSGSGIPPAVCVIAAPPAAATPPPGMCAAGREGAPGGGGGERRANNAELLALFTAPEFPDSRRWILIPGRQTHARF